MLSENWETVLLVCTVIGGLLLALLWWCYSGLARGVHVEKKEDV